MFKDKFNIYVFAILALIFQTLFAQEHTLELKNLDRGQIHFAGFALNSDKTVHIKAVGSGDDKMIKRVYNFHEDKHNLFAYAWIVDADTREMVWRMTVDNTEKSWWDKWNREFNGKVKLKKGKYELYFSAVEPNLFSFNGRFLDFGKLLDKIFGGDNWWEDHSDKWMTHVSGVDEVFTKLDVKKYQKKLKESAIIDFTDARDEFYISEGFSLTKPLGVTIYFIGEGYKGKMFDYGWIIDADSREKVWEMCERETEYAGGAMKNRLYRETIKLETGNYLAYFRTDDSHSAEKWNANPPYDPYFWGMLIQSADKDFNPSIIKEYSEIKQQSLISITRVGDYAYKDKGFQVTKTAKIRIYALGEGKDGDMFDYGWISDADNGKIVWKMRYRKTKHAGGASKNRLYDDVIELDPGKYIVHYQTDDSHSYEDWNESSPQEPEKWGISIYPLGKDNSVKLLDKKQLRSKNILAQLIRVGDDEHVKKQFTLEKTARVRIYCVGEGDWDEMYDYGWIENVETNQKVWKMRYSKTFPAGGAKKNRKVDSIITLKPGTYCVHYRTDDSHSYYDWNAKAPDDMINWGVTIYLLDNE